jgi:hypothetical protein
MPEREDMLAEIGCEALILAKWMATLEARNNRNYV